MINLCLVVIATQFSETKKRETERMMQERKRFQSTSTLASNSEPGGCYKEILKYLAHLWRRAKRKIVKLYYDARGKTHPHRKIKPALTLRKKKRKGTTMQSSRSCQKCCSQRYNYYYQLIGSGDNNHISRRNSSPLAPRASPEMSDIESISSPRRPNFLTVPSINSLHPDSSESVNTLALAAAETLASPSLSKSHISSPNHLSPHAATISRTSSFNSGVSRKTLPSLPEILAANSAKNVTLATSNSLLNAVERDTRAKLLRRLSSKGEY